MDPAGSIAPLVAYLSHSECPTTGHFMECGAGWVARSRLQRAKGANMRPDASLTTGAIRERFQEISDFTDADVPEIIQAVVGGQGMTRLEKALASAPSPKAEDLRYDGRVAGEFRDMPVLSFKPANVLLVFSRYWSWCRARKSVRDHVCQSRRQSRRQ
jgi:hypothetical protein